MYSYVLAICLLAACTSSAQQSRPTDPPVNPAPAPSRPAEAAQQMPKGTNTNPDAKMMADFKSRVDAYVSLRDGLSKKAPQLKRTEQPADISQAEKSLAAQIRAARATAKRGDIFSPATQAMFRRMLSPTVKGKDGAENKQAIKDDAPEPKEIPFQVNAAYPKDVALSTMPPDVLLSLPELPKEKEVEYRFAGKHLILYDAKANLIIDFMLNALP
jgi:hypothetical protein